MVKCFIAVLTLFAVGCNPNRSEVPSANYEAVLTAGTEVPVEFRQATKMVNVALNEFNQRLTPEVVKAYNGRVDLVMADMDAYVQARVGAMSAQTAAGARMASDAPSQEVTNELNKMNAKLDELDTKIAGDLISDTEAAEKQRVILAETYGAATVLNEGDRNALKGATYAANELSLPAEEILKKILPNGGASPNGRVAAGWFKKLKRAVISVVRQITMSTVKSFLKGCVIGTVQTGTFSGCVRGGVTQASQDLNKNAGNAISNASK